MPPIPSSCLQYDITPVRAFDGAGLRGLNITNNMQVDWKL
jgi:hypothetical protein